MKQPVKKGFLSICLLLHMGILRVAAQQASSMVILPVKDSSGKSLPDASVEWLRARDSTLVISSITGEGGEAMAEGLFPGQYLARVSLVGFQVAWSPAFEVQEQSPMLTLAPLIMIYDVSPLKGVTVSARKPFLQKLSDRIVVNVDNGIVSAGSVALDVLERSPGIQFDVNDNILMRGRAGVTIMIDGKPSPMTGADLVNFLRSVPVHAIESIHLITNPSARYDASGNSGIIDIRMKKDQRLGANGTVNAGYGQGVYPKANAGFTFNYRSRKVNVFGNYAYTYRMNLNHLLLDRNFFTQGEFSGKDQKDNYTRIPVNAHNARIGSDFFLGKMTTIGVVASGNFTSVDPANDNHSVVSDYNKEPLYRFETQSQNHNRNNNLVFNLNFRHQFDSTGHELTADIDFGRFSSEAQSSTATSYYALDGSMLRPDYVLDGLQAGSLQYQTGKVDYMHPLGKKGKLEAGAKVSFVNSDNDARFYDMSGGTPTPDVTKTNRFFYKENNNAAYLNLRTSRGRWDGQLGLRAEQTHVKTCQQVGDIRWDSSYLQFFPSLYLTYKPRENHALGASVSRRIDRPGYSQLNPFLYLIDVTTYSTGNPGLLPQFTWNYELSYTLKSMSLTLAYSRTQQPQNVVVARFRDVFPAIPAEDNVTVQIPVNLEASDYFGLTFASPVRIRPWWNSINNVTLYYNHFSGTMGTTQLDNGRMVLSLSTNNTFTLTKGWSAELNGTYNSGGQYGFMVMNDQWGIGAGVQKNILKGRGSLRLNVTDIFWTNLPAGTITYDNYKEYWKAYRETRVANLQFSCRLGNNKVQAARRRSLGSEEEQRRAQ